MLHKIHKAKGVVKVCGGKEAGRYAWGWEGWGQEGQHVQPGKAEAQAGNEPQQPCPNGFRQLAWSSPSHQPSTTNQTVCRATMWAQSGGGNSGVWWWW